MGKTYRDNVIFPRSQSFKSDHNRGWARELDRHSHHSHRNMNRNCSEDGTFVPFGRGFKRENCFSLQYGKNVCNNSYNLEELKQNHKDACDWNHLPLKQCLLKVVDREKKKNEEYGRGGNSLKKYAKATLKQLERRGSASRFKGHDKFSEKYEAVTE